MLLSRAHYRTCDLRDATKAILGALGRTKFLAFRSIQAMPSSAQKQTPVVAPVRNPNLRHAPRLGWTLAQASISACGRKLVRQSLPTNNREYPRFLGRCQENASKSYRDRLPQLLDQSDRLIHRQFFGACRLVHSCCIQDTVHGVFVEEVFHGTAYDGS